ncbi:hypothetical protein BCR44DRAFT_35462 [Catenaria anguillulae PL171]|uniref:Threonine/serine exporter-like N-terminal domain-containing protein n=1 Tax=Catenaria anguillulae PL171 TaxID=765915 RepID=A0A1Y2HMI5_9FUNG|nr:hypothetical protein BCR44DRAFT_35462 [Catenaria anguillulae PL171]
MGIHKTPKSLIQTLSLSPLQLQAYTDELDAILAAPDTFPRWLTVLCQGTTGMLLAALWIPVTPLDLTFTFLMGIVHGLMLVAEQQYKIMAMDVGIPLVVGALARAAELWLGRDQVCFATMAVMSSFSYFPGVPITLAMVEFAAYNTMTGVVRLLDAFLRIFKLGFGMVMGAAITSAIALGHSGMGDTTCMSTRRPGSVVVKTMYPVIPLVAIPLVCGMNVVLKAQYRQFGWMVLVGGSSLATYLIALINDLDPGIAASICSLVASLLSQLLANRFNHVGIATLIAGLIWLNPGPPFIRGAMLMLNQDIQSSVVFATEAVVRALSIILGLYVSRLLVTPVLRAGRGGGSRLADLSA